MAGFWYNMGYENEAHSPYCLLFGRVFRFFRLGADF